MKAVILAAGLGKRLQPLTLHLPKCLVKVGGKSLLERQLEALAKWDWEEVIVVVGYKRDRVEALLNSWKAVLPIRSIFNPQYRTTNTAWSLSLALDEYPSDLLYLNGDVLVPDEALLRVITSSSDSVMGIITGLCGEEEVKVVSQGDRIVKIGKDISPNEANGEFVGIAHFTPEAVNLLKASLFQMRQSNSQQNAYFEEALHPILPLVKVGWVELGDLLCMEIDDLKDLTVAQRWALESFSLVNHL
ncbi:MAG: sugar phosphate nucleotidyltransferase [bacterium]